MIILEKNISIALIIRTFSRYGGTERDCFSLYQHLKNAGFDVFVICGSNRSGLSDPRIKEIGYLKPGRFLKALSFYSRAGRWVSKRRHKYFSVAFVRVSGCHLYRIGAGPHLDFIRLSMKGYDSYYRKISKAISRFIRPVNWLIPILEKRIFTDIRTQKIIAVSSMVAKHVMARYHLSPEKLFVVPNGVDLTKFNPTMDKIKKCSQKSKLRDQFKIAGDRKVIGFCSTNFELKGLRQLIITLSRLPEHFHLFVAGDRNPGKYLRLAKNHHLGARITFLGRVEDMVAFYEGIDLLCHPSFYDSFGNVIPEALAMNIPVVTSRYAGASDIITEGLSGYIVSEITPENLSDAIMKAAKLDRTDFRSALLPDHSVFDRYIEIIKSGYQIKAAEE